MKAMTNAEFEQFARGLAEHPPKFEPTSTYDPDGDCIEFVARPDSFYGERVDDLLTVYYSHETNEVIGSLLKGVSGFCASMLEKCPGFKIEIQDGRVRLEHLFLAKLWSTEFDKDNVAVVTYRKLIEVAEETKAEAQILCEA